MAPVRTSHDQELSIADAVRDEASQLVAQAHDRRVDRFTMHLEDGSPFEVPPQLSAFLSRLVHNAASGAVIFTSSLPEELTTTTAAEQLGVSRPTLMKIIEAGDLPSTKVGTHTRLRRDDVLQLRDEREARRKKAAIEMLRAGEAFD